MMKAKEASQLGLREALPRLRSDRSAIPWPNRRDLGRRLAAALQAEVPPNAALPLVFLLAEDPKPEVRQAIANLLPLLGEADLVKVAAKLSNDSNAFVQKAVERSLDRRRRGQQDAHRRRRKVEQVEASCAMMERLHGKPAADRARQMCERFAEVLIGTTVHNLRGVLTPMKLNVAALLKQIGQDHLDGKVLKDTAGKIADRIGFVERLLEDMRAYSQPVVTVYRRERLTDVVAEARAAVADYFRAGQRDAASVTLTVLVPENITVDMARHQMVVAIANVLKNAYEAFGGEGAFREGEIRLETQIVGGEVRIVVQDNGAGLAEEDLRELREFIPGRTSKKNHGTGFGLPIARRYVLAHGGTLAIDSQAGCGTTVTITLPLEHEEPEEV